MTAGTALASPSSNNTVPRNTSIVNNNISKSGGDNSENSDLQSTAKGISEPDISKDTRSHEEQVYELSSGKENEKTAARNFVQKIGKALGVKVVFEDTVQKRGYWSDGYIDEKGTIYIDYDNENPITFIFRHELVHYGRISPIYERFEKLVRGSKIFEQWLLEKSEMPEGTSVSRMEAWYKTQVEKSRPNENLSEEELTEEMIADFVGSEAFKKGGSGLAAMSTEMTAKEHNVVLQYIIDFISWIKKKINKVQGADKLTFELSRIEDSFNRMISDAKQNPTERKLKHSIAGIRAKTANLTEQGNAKRAINFGEDSEIARKSTGWWQGKDGEWRFYIPDNEMEFYPEGLVENPKTLGDYLKHDKLFAAYPELRNIKLTIGELSGGKKGRYSSEKNEIVLNKNVLKNNEQMKDTLIHEIQHAIQDIEGFAKGGDKRLGLIYAINSTYQNAKNADGFAQLSKEEKFEYLFNLAMSDFNAKDLGELAYKAYKQIYGEVEARNVAQIRNFDADMLKLSKPDTFGNIVDRKVETETFIDNMKQIGYTEEEIRDLLGGNDNDQSGSIGDIEEGMGRDGDDYGLGRRIISSSVDGNISYQGEGEGRPNVLGQGISSEISNKGQSRIFLDKVKAELNNSAFSMPEKIRRSVPIDTSYMSFETLTEKYNQGKISQEDYMRRVAELYDEKVNEQGALKKGEKGKRKIDKPLSRFVDFGGVGET